MALTPASAQLMGTTKSIFDTPFCKTNQCNLTTKKSFPASPEYDLPATDLYHYQLKDGITMIVTRRNKGRIEGVLLGTYQVTPKLATVATALHQLLFGQKVKVNLQKACVPTPENYGVGGGVGDPPVSSIKTKKGTYTVYCEYVPNASGDTFVNAINLSLANP